ncbi:putative tripartite motif-containing protein 61 [Sorex fumeus]|uniref:putative tripartite motif-containing protein 61 n=1 Tax=Sorex fumeus TaxID=62283 RepID=UPI0024AD7D2D|nr:putative tripartite motif-containing protein 61 [Sorex fumeus]
MAFSASLTEIPAEASCPRCLDYLREPVTLEWGHNFCDSCIHQCWVDLQDVFPCPVCLRHCPDRNFKRNKQLCHITEVLKQLPTGRSKRKWQAEEPLCEKHNEAVDLFCEEDQELLCPQCRVSTHNQGHHLIPTDRAAESQRKKLKGFIELLKTKMSDAKKECENQIAQSVGGRWKIASWKGELQAELEQFKLSLRDEQFSIHASLLNREREMEEKIAQNKSQILSSMDTVKNLLRDITEKCLQADQDLLASVENLQKTNDVSILEDNVVCAMFPSPDVETFTVNKAFRTSPKAFFPPVPFPVCLGKLTGETFVSSESLKPSKSLEMLESSPHPSH